MYVDLLTLYLLATGTLLVSAVMTYWEHRSNPSRSRQLRVFAAGFATLALGCATVLIRQHLPGISGSVLSNLIILTGYLLILNGVASFSGRHYAKFSVTVILVMALIWLLAGSRWHDVLWNYVTSFPIALVSGLTAWEVLRCDALKTMQSRHIVVLVTSVHTISYACRAFVLPWLVVWLGPSVLSLSSKMTIYEGVLYSVLLPMTLLKLVREESHCQLLRESQTDYLTRLGNRRWFFEEGARVLGNSPQGPIAILAFDLDQFKAINDRYGHQVGDDVIKSFANTVKNVMGSGVIVARLGGEEFAALLDADKARRAHDLGDAIATRFAQTITKRFDDHDVLATVSIGLAYYASAAPSLAQGLADADQALYRAKSLGGNRLERAHAAG